MFKSPSRYFILTAILTIVTLQPAVAGPPFNTDDPQPVDLHHWEYYIASINTFTTNTSIGTSPHIELNYGLVPDVQVHLILPLNYESTRMHGFHAGYADTEVGLKYRFVQETENMPQIGTFPILEIPTIHNPEFGNGQVQLFIPVWLQKSWGKLTSYGGAGYWINPGSGNRNWLFAGWEGQYDFSKVITLGGELYYHTPDTIDSNLVAAFNIGGSINPSDKFHIIFSIGHSMVNEPFTTTYVGLLWTI
jgi:hypothetical protein